MGKLLVLFFEGENLLFSNLLKAAQCVLKYQLLEDKDQCWPWQSVVLPID